MYVSLRARKEGLNKEALKGDLLRTNSTFFCELWSLVTFTLLFFSFFGMMIACLMYFAAKNFRFHDAQGLLTYWYFYVSVGDEMLQNHSNPLLHLIESIANE